MYVTLVIAMGAYIEYKNHLSLHVDISQSLL